MAEWWQRGIIYQIYPRSFQDTNQDGIGDLVGIIKRLDHLDWLGIDAIWISPIYPSPMKDFGYDISDYRDVDPMFGTLDDMDELVAEAHARSIRVILDYVPGHTSDRHPWFHESRSSRDNPKRDWYIWREPAPDGGPPNNWLSRFDGKPAWTWDTNTEQYYYHTFLAEQPELNWRNPEVREAMSDVLRFWLDRGIDGFRVDVAYRVMKDAQFRDNPPNPKWRAGMDPQKRLLETYTKDLPEAHEVGRLLRSVIDEYDDRVLIGEINMPLEGLMVYYGDNDEYHLPFNFRLIYSPWDAGAVQAVIDRFERLVPAGAWPNYVLGNHDQHRIASRVGRAQARVGMMLLLTLRGTPTMYYGEELGMHDVEIPPEKVQDPWEKYTPGLGLGRDPERTPMQWDTSPNAGFCAPEVEPWLPVADDYETYNVAVESDDTRSMLSFTRELIALRNSSPALHAGAHRSLDAPEGAFAYQRQSGDERFFIVLNFTDQPNTWKLPAEIDTLTVTLSTHMDRTAEVLGEAVGLRANEGVILARRIPTHS